MKNELIILWLKLRLSYERLRGLYFRAQVTYRRWNHQRLNVHLEESRANLIRLGGARKLMEIDEDLENRKAA